MMNNAPKDKSFLDDETPPTVRRGGLLIGGGASIGTNDDGEAGVTCVRPVRTKGGAIMEYSSERPVVYEKRARHLAEKAAALIVKLGL